MIILTCACVGAADGLIEWDYEARGGGGVRADPPIPTEFDVQLVLDDDTSEGAFGIGGATAQQFLWFNRFTVNTGPMWLDQIWVLFPTGPNMNLGAPVELVVYHDRDGDPSTGADFVISLDVTVQSVDGDTFSVYQFDPPVYFNGPQDVLIGVINRFVDSGVTSTTRPAAIDTTSSQGSSWLAVWNGDPPSPPTMPPDGLIANIDDFVPGNWMIRAFGRQQGPGIPAQNQIGLLVLVVMIAAAGFVLLTRGRL